jgi:hypothetical protein
LGTAASHTQGRLPANSSTGEQRAQIRPGLCKGHRKREEETPSPLPFPALWVPRGKMTSTQVCLSWDPLMTGFPGQDPLLLP